MSTPYRYIIDLDELERQIQAIKEVREVAVMPKAVVETFDLWKMRTELLGLLGMLTSLQLAFEKDPHVILHGVRFPKPGAETDTKTDGDTESQE